MSCCNKRIVTPQVIRQITNPALQPKPVIIKVDQNRQIANIKPSQVDAYRVNK